MKKALFSINKGFSLIEILISVFVFLIFSFVFFNITINSIKQISHTVNKERAVSLAEEGLEAVRSIKNNDFNLLIDGTYGLNVSNNQFNLSGSADLTDIFTRTIMISTIENDFSIKRIESTVTWQENKSIILTTYFTDWGSMVDERSPIGYWPLDENQGCLTFDFYGNNNGVLDPNCPDNSPLWVDGKINSSLFFDGTNKRVSVPNSTELNPREELTLSAWVKWDIEPGMGNNWATIINKNIDRQYRLQHSRDNDFFEFAIRTSSGNRWVLSNTRPTQGDWYHLAGTYDGQEIKIYVNGILENSVNWTGDIETSLNPLIFGNRAIGDRGFNGIIDEIGIWGLALNTSEIEEIYLNGLDILIETCEDYCISINYLRGVCRQNPRQCQNNQEIYEVGGDLFCPGPPMRNCCCQ